MSDPYIGEIRMFGGNFAPVGWLFCQGQILPISQYDVLFNLIGTTYGGDGQETFALPNLASRIPFHQGSGYVLGQMGGVESVTLTGNQLPVHKHVPMGLSTGAGQTNPTGMIWGNWGQQVYQTAAPNATMSGQALALSGGNQPHENMPPFLVINFILATEGIYPSPN